MNNQCIGGLNFGGTEAENGSICGAIEMRHCGDGILVVTVWSMIHYTQEQQQLLASRPISLRDWRLLNDGRRPRYIERSKVRTRKYTKPPYKR
jgi:hypothetical protein